jgi:hypothetical protein
MKISSNEKVLRSHQTKLLLSSLLQFIETFVDSVKEKRQTQHF